MSVSRDKPATTRRPIVVHFTSVHYPFDTRIFQKECHTLRAAGYDVILIAPHDHSQVVDGITIRAVPVPRTRFERLTRTIWHVFRATLREKGQVYHFHDPELMGVGVVLKLLGRPVVYDVHENVPADIMTKKWLPAWGRRIVGALYRMAERTCGQLLDGIIVAGSDAAASVRQARTVEVFNYPIAAELVINSAVPYDRRNPVITFVGGLSVARAVRETVRAMALLPKELEAKLILAGRFEPPSLKGELSRLDGWDRVEVRGWQSRTELAQLLSQCRIGVVLLYPEPNHLEVRSNRVFEYMSTGVPVVASDLPRWRELIEGIGCGLVVDPCSPESIAEAISWLLRNPGQAQEMGLRGAAAVRTRYNWQKEAERLVSLYERILSTRSGRSTTTSTPRHA